MGEHPNATVFRSLIDAFNSGDMEVITSVIDDDVVWHEIGKAEPVRGKAALGESMLDFPEDVSVTAVLHDVVANDDHVVGLISATAVGGDRTLEYRTAEIAHMANGKVTERWSFSDDTAQIQEFFSHFG
jgi:ketosteroid isomerase-like protein